MCGQELHALMRQPACDCCAYPLAMMDDPCPRCLHKPGRVIGRLAALGLHEGVLRELVIGLKFRRRWQVVEELCPLLAANPTACEILGEAELLVPVPLHWVRRFQRGYNQAELVAHALRRDRLRVCSALKRGRATETQSLQHSLTARARNVRGCFRLTRRAAEMEGKRVVLIDDVYTTGATLRAAARALKPAWARSIDAIVLTTADPRRGEIES